MGVRGLQTFLKENRQSLCTSVQFPTRQEVPTDRTAIIVDAWGIIYQLYLDGLPWCSGGEYLRFYRIVKRLIASWRRVGLEPTFVFDGSSPPEKHNTILSRIRQNYKTALLFHTTSITSRSSPSFSRSTTILPPFVAQTFVHALQSLDVETYFTPSGEADGLCVTIANQLHGYVLGNDSDFLILVSSPNAVHVKGYCPLDMLMWIEGSSGPDQKEADKEDDEWSTSKPKRNPPPARQSHFLPPANYHSPILVFTSISPSALRTRFRLPASVLPLLASFVGNDYTPLHYSETFFENSLSAVQRIEKVARMLRETVFAPPNKQGINAGDQAVDLVQKVIKKLAVRGFVSDSQLREMVDTIIESTFQYILPPLPDIGTLHPFDQTPRMSEHTVDMDEDYLALIEQAKSSYADLQKRGMGGALTHAYLFPGRLYLWPILEDPAGPSLRASDALRGIRREAWNILEQGCGGLCWPEPTDEEIKALKEDKELQDLLGVVEEIRAGQETKESLQDGVEVDGQSDSDGSSGSDGSLTSEEITLVNEDSIVKSEAGLVEEEESDEMVKLKATRQRVVREYVRQGSSQKINETLVPLPPVDLSSTPLCLQPLDQRLNKYLESFQSNLPSITPLSPHLHPLIAIMRMTILEVSLRAGPKLESKLRGFEVVAILKMGIGMLSAWEKEEHSTKTKKDNDTGNWPLVGSRQIGIVSQLNAILLESLLLAQSLFLSPEQGQDQGPAEKRLTHLTPFMFFSGVALLNLLDHQEPPISTGWTWTEKENDLLQSLKTVTVDGLMDHIVGWNQEKHEPPSPEKGVKEKKKEKKKEKSGGFIAQASKTRFDLLDGIGM